MSNHSCATYKIQLAATSVAQEAGKEYKERGKGVKVVGQNRHRLDKNSTRQTWPSLLSPGGRSRGRGREQ